MTHVPAYGALLKLRERAEQRAAIALASVLADLAREARLLRALRIDSESRAREVETRGKSLHADLAAKPHAISQFTRAGAYLAGMRRRLQGDAKEIAACEGTLIALRDAVASRRAELSKCAHATQALRDLIQRAQVAARAAAEVRADDEANDAHGS